MVADALLRIGAVVAPVLRFGHQVLADAQRENRTFALFALNEIPRSHSPMSCFKIALPSLCAIWRPGSHVLTSILRCGGKSLNIYTPSAILESEPRMISSRRICVGWHK